MPRKKQIASNTNEAVTTLLAAEGTGDTNARPSEPIAMTPDAMAYQAPGSTPAEYATQSQSAQQAGVDQPDTDREEPRQWSNPYKALFTSAAGGFEMGENRRFKQRVFTFSVKPDPAIIETLKENGFSYRAAEKAWTIPANPDTRRLSEELAQQFAGPDQGMSR